LDSEGKRAVGVDASVATNNGVPPEVIDCEGTKDYIGVVNLGVVANPGSDESPGSLDCRISTPACLLSGLATLKLLAICTYLEQGVTTNSLGPNEL
jgi:hypothetical protein